MTIFALATMPGKSGVAVIRVSGRKAAESCKALGIALPAPRMAMLSVLRDGKEVIDRALVIYFQAPHSFTGEDVVEFHLHGSRAVIAHMLDCLGALPGFRAAQPGEFTRRAFLNGKMDLTAAEGLADLIDAETAAQAKQAMRLMQGEAATLFEQLRSGILHALAYLEAYIDFPDEEIPDHVLVEVTAETVQLQGQIASLLAGPKSAEKLRDGIHIAIIGAPNVGKSSLLNILAGRDAAIVSSTAGTTRDVVEVQLDLGGYRVILADTAGIRATSDEVEQEGVRRSLKRAEEADIKLLVLDASKPELPKDLIDANTLIVCNKTDLSTPTLSLALPHPAIAVSAKTRAGVDHLLEVLQEKIISTYPAESPLITRARHRSHLTQALHHLEQFARASDKGLELQCEELRRAAQEIGSITGIISTDELLGHIFSSFCIGK